MKDVIAWLVQSEPWVEYNARVHLLNQPEKSPAVISAKKIMLKDSKIKKIIEDLHLWPGSPLKRHNDANHLLHKLTLAADLGLTQEDDGIQVVIDKISNRKSEEGVFQVLVNIPIRFGGSGTDQFSWMLCDAPLIMYAIAKFGLDEEKDVEQSAKHIVSLIRENGWPCAVSNDLGKFRGPGRKADPCPYANLAILKALSQMKKWRNSNECKIGAESLLELWEKRKEKKPYLFGMGSRFKKLKVPLIWYDVLHVTEVLSQFHWLRNDERLIEMVDIIKQKADEKGRYTAESVWRAWKGWDFGQKREPSAWLTFLVERILKRMRSQ